MTYPSASFLQAMLLSPQAERNWEGLCSMLEDVLEDQSHRQLFALELGSGTGQHVIRFAQKMPFVTWQPSDIKEESRDRFVSCRERLPGVMLPYVHQTHSTILLWICTIGYSSDSVDCVIVSFIGNRMCTFWFTYKI